METGTSSGLMGHSRLDRRLHLSPVILPALLSNFRSRTSLMLYSTDSHSSGWGKEGGRGGKREKKVWEAGFSRWRELGEIEKNTVSYISQ